MMSVHRPVLDLQSPSLSVLQPTSEIKGRLSFSSVKTPPLPSKRLLYNDVTPTNFNNRLGEYHMSKQNPAVLDRMYSSPSSPQKEQLYKTVSPLVNHTARLNGSGIVLRNCRSPLHTSLLKQTLGRVRRNSLPGQSSLVHMAVHGSQRHYDSVGVSPVIVKLSSPEPTNRSRSSGRLSLEASSWQNGERTSMAAPNPCDKTTVLSALKQKRKRWATSSDDNSPTESVLPQAKRSRHSTQTSSNAPSSTYSNQHLFDRKRPNVTSVPHHAPALKKTRMTDALVDSLRARKPKSTSHKLTVPEIEYESDGESVSGGGGGSVREDSVEPLDTNSTGTRSIGNGERRGSATPPVQEGETEEDVELKKKQEESLKLQKSLTAVFPPSLTRQSSLRRKVPVFCATGAKPLLPTPLSVSHSATEEDLKRDRQAATTKIKRFLSKDDDQLPPNSPSASSSSSASVASVLPTASSSTTSTTASINGGLQLGIPATLTLASVGQTSANSLAVNTTASLVGTLASTQALSIQATPLSSTVCTTITTTANAPVMSTGLNGLSVPLASQTNLQHGGATVSSGQLTSNQSGALKSVSFSLPASTSTSLTTSQSQIQTATISTTASGQLSLGNTQFNTNGLGVPLLPRGSATTTVNAATCMTQLNPSFQFQQSTTTSTGTAVNTAQLNPPVQFQQSTTTSAGTLNTIPSFQFQQSTTTSAGTVKTAQLNPSFQFQQSTTASSSSVPPSNTASGFSFSTNSLPLQMPSNGNPASLQPQNTSGSQQLQQQSSISLQLGVAAQNSMFAGVQNAPNSGSLSTTSLVPPTTTTQQSLFLQNAAPLQTSSARLFPAPGNNTGSGLSVPTLPAATTSQQTLAGFFSQKTTSLQTTSANLFAGMAASSTTTSNPTFTFNLSNNPGQQQNQLAQNQTAPSGLFAQVQNPLNGGGAGSGGPLQQNGTNLSQGINFNIPKTTASNGAINFSVGPQQQQQQKNTVSFFGANSQTNPPSFKFTAGVNVPSSGQPQQTNTRGLFAGNPNNNGFNFAANMMQSAASQKSAGFFNPAQPLTTTAQSGFNFSTGANLSLPKQPQQQLGSFNFTGGANLNQSLNQGSTNVPAFGGANPALSASGGMFNFSANSSAQQNQTQTGTLFGGAFKSSIGEQRTAPSQIQNGFNFTPAAGTGLGQINFTGGGSSNQPTATPIFGSHQGNVAGGFGGFQTPKTSLNFASPSLNGQQTPSNGRFNFSAGVATDSPRQVAKPRRRRK